MRRSTFCHLQQYDDNEVDEEQGPTFNLLIMNDSKQDNEEDEEKEEEEHECVVPPPT